jgi:hypothetical protein
MLNDHEAHRQHVLTMIEQAQKSGRTEPEIVAIVERLFNTDAGDSQKRERSLLSRLRRAA